ncbi:hypothetical protein FRC11_007463, partial [Ceratobasidium sp. 423]
MSYRDKLRKVRSDFKSLLSPGLGRGIRSSRSPSPAPGSTNTPASVAHNDEESLQVEDPNVTSAPVLSGTTPPTADEGEEIKPEAVASGPTPGSDSHGWTCLRQLFKILESNTKTFGPIREAVGGLIECIDIFETLSKQCQEYKLLQGELEEISKQLQACCSQAMSPTMTITIEGLCKSIQQEISYVREKQDRGGVRKYIEAEDDAGVVLACYRRIQGHLQRVADNKLDRMSPALSACYGSAQAVELKRGACTEGTRVDLLAQMLTWTDNADPGAVYWMSGMAGTGKTTIAYSLCQELEASRRLAASFFCSRLRPECRDISRIIPSIAYQLARFSHPFRYALFNVLEGDPDAHTRLPHLQFESLIARPLLEVKESLPDILVVVIDALDECENKEGTSRILDVLLTGSANLPAKFVVSSRPEPEIREEMEKQTDQTGSRVVLHELGKDGVRADIKTYLQTALARIQPNDDQIEALVERAGVLFIYAATVVRYIGYKNFRGNSRARLENVLNSSSAVEKNSDIDRLYSTILQAALEDPDLGTTDIDDIRRVLHTAICAQEPLTVDLISQFLRIPDTHRVRTALEPLWSVLHISGSSQVVATLHASFPDYMFDPSRSHQYHCDPQAHNQTLALRCFDYFRDIRPQFNICDLNSSFVLDEKVAGLEERVKNRITEQVFYAARYWASHLCSANGSPNLIQELEEFLSVRLLLWMEVMNLKKCTGSMAGIIRRVEKWDVDYPAGLMELIRDGSRFATTFSSNPVSASTPHIYTSMLSFWPGSSAVSKLYRKYTPRLIELEGTAVGRLQRALLAVWHYENLASSIFSPDGSQIAALVRDRVVLLNASTGQIELSLEYPFKDSDDYYDHSSGLVRFSPKGTLLVSTANAFSDFCIRNVKSGKQLVRGDVGPIYSTGFSPDETRIAFGSEDGFVYVLDAHTGQHLMKLVIEEGIQRKIIAVKYSPDGCHLVACDTDGNIMKWDDKRNQAHKTRCQFEGHYNIEVLDISPNCTHIATACQRNIHTWDVETGQVTLGPLHIPDLNFVDRRPYEVSSLSYSPDGLYLVSGLDVSDVCMWDAQTGFSLLHFPGAHKYGVHSVSFSPDSAYIVSSAMDDTIRLWDATATQVSYDPLPGHTTPVTSAGFSPDGSHIVSGAMYGDVCAWNAETGELVFQRMNQQPIDAILGGGVLVAYSSDGTRITALIYPGRVGPLLPTKSDVLYPIHRSSAFTPAVLSEDSTCHLSALSSYPVQVFVSNTSDTVGFIFPPTEDNFDQVSVDMVSGRSYDEVGNRVSCFWGQYNSLVMYDACSGDLLSELPKGQYIDSRTIQFSPSGAQVVRYRDSRIMVYDIRSGDVILGPLEGHTGGVTSIHWSPDGTRIVSGALDNSICVWDAQTDQRMLGPVKWHTGDVQSVRFSPDSTRVVSGSDDKTIRITDIRMWADI